MTYIDDCEGCGAFCFVCGRTWCRAEVVSPGEADGICTDCFEMEDGG